MKRDTIFKATLTILLFTCLISCRQAGNTESESSEMLPDDIVEMRQDQAKLAGIELGGLEIRSIDKTLRVNGIVTVSPNDIATVCAPLGGFVRSAELIPGNPVVKGQTLALIENQEFVDIQENYLETRNRFEYAEAEYNRNNELFRQDIASEKNMQQVTSEYKSLKAQVNAYQQKLKLIGIDPGSLTEDNIKNYTALVSPINGFVKTANINIGKYSAPTDVMFEIVNNEDLFLELSLFEKDASKPEKGQNITFFINNETEPHSAVVWQTGKSISDDRTFKLFARVTSKCKNVLPGMYVNAILELSSSKKTALPNDAVVSFDDKDYIFIYNREKEENGQPFTEYRMVEVRKGESDNDFTEVTLPEGLNPEPAKIVIKGAYNLLSAKKNAGEMAC